MPPEKDRYLLASLHGRLELLDCFATRDPWSLGELAAHLGQNKALVFRVLHILQAFGYVAKDAASGCHGAGLRLHALGSAAVRHEPLCWQALPPSQDLAKATGETVHVGILHEGVIVPAQIVEGTHAVRMHSSPGKRRPAHASALGKVLLAHLADAELDAFVARQGLPFFTVSTLVTSEALHRARQEGIICDAEEIEIGLRCLAAPFTENSGRPMAALGLSAPTSRMDVVRIAALVPQVKTVAGRISRMLGSPSPVCSAAHRCPQPDP